MNIYTVQKTPGRADVVVVVVVDDDDDDDDDNSNDDDDDNDNKIALTTRECVHLVTRVHFRSRDKDGGYTIRSAVSEKPVLHANITAPCLIERELLPIEVLPWGI